MSISCRSVTVGYLGSKVLQDISFTIDKPAVYVVLGPNGAGKTTLFRTLAGILQPYQGDVFIGKESINRQASRNQLHYLSHVDGVPDDLRVREALEFYARVERASPDDISRVLDQLEIRDLCERYLSQLSAGQRKRVSIARVFLRERAIYLLDEPTSNLDPKLAREIRNLILELGHDKIVLYSSHNLFEAREIGGYVLVVKDGRLTMFDRIENLKGSRFVVGVRVLEPSPVLASWPREGEYFLHELSGPEEVPALLRDLDTHGVKIREIREMGNPLEELFT
ncbi:MAG TPA: heme ABC exporter ATP-binding protein CcmA [Candidatus Bathyarchaeia archaeon]|nr:heme ABC exporter ATP-binding protein CcmA [Candidatus Bathyarchaeia archaeon]